MNKPILNSPIGPLPFIDSVPGFIVPTLLSVIRKITKTHLIFMSLTYEF